MNIIAKIFLVILGISGLYYNEKGKLTKVIDIRDQI